MMNKLVSYHCIKPLTENTTDSLLRFYTKTMQRRQHVLLFLIHAFPFEKSFQTLREPSSDSSEKRYSLLHFCRISVLIEFIILGKAKLSMASCSF